MKSLNLFFTDSKTSMKAKLVQNIAIGLLVLCALGLGVWLFLFLKKDYVHIPENAQVKYVEVGAKYEKSFGSSLMKCHSDKGEIFVVSGSSGYTGITYYFDLTGNTLGSFESSDVVVGNGPTPPVQVEYGSCKILKESNKRSLQQ